MSIIGDGILLGAGGESASIFVTGLSETDTVIAEKGGKTAAGKWVSKRNPACVLPDGYTQLEHIESTGTQYIDTGVVPSEVGYKAEVSFRATSVPSSGESWILAAYQSSSANWRCGFSNGSFHTSGGFSYSQTSSTTADTVAESENSMTPALSLYLFCQHESSGAVHTGNSKYKLYYCNISKNGMAVRKFIPAKRNSDSVIGLYDLVNDVFYTNSGTGVFTAGAEVPQAIDGFLIDKIKEYGTWTVTATNSTNTATSDVVVDSALEYVVEMDYKLWLYKDGDECTDVTGGWNALASGSSGSLTKNSSSFTLAYYSGMNAYDAITKNTVDISDYSKLYIDWIFNSSKGGNARIGVSSSAPSGDVGLSKYSIISAAYTGVTELDVSDVSGQYYAVVTVYNESVTVNKIWLE